MGGSGVLQSQLKTRRKIIVMFRIAPNEIRRGLVGKPVGQNPKLNRF